MHLDFVLADPRSLTVVLVIELDDKSFTGACRGQEARPCVQGFGSGTRLVCPCCG